MKITSSRKDDILKRKAQYESDLAAYEERSNQSRKALHDAENAVMQPIKDYLEQKLGKYSALTFDIRVDRAYMGRNDSGVRVRIRCNERNKFDDDVALAWSYDVDLSPEGEVIRETSSWSGLSATTVAQMTSLRQTVAALDTLNDIDWDTLIKVDMPAYDDYYDPSNKPPASEDWSAQLQEAEIEELIGSDKFVKVRNWGESCPVRGDIWLRFRKETPSMYFCTYVHDWLMSKAQNGDPNAIQRVIDAIDNQYVNIRVRKSSVRLAEPTEVVDLNDLKPNM